jgi:hypothetical protein
MVVVFVSVVEMDGGLGLGDTKAGFTGTGVVAVDTGRVDLGGVVVIFRSGVEAGLGDT